MNASFTTQFPKTAHPLISGMHTHFVPKILKGIEQLQPDNEMLYFHYQEYVMLQRKLNKDYTLDVQHPKLHTIREDQYNRWKTGNLIHFYIYTRTKNQLRFAPILKCTSVQKIEILWHDPDGVVNAIPNVYVNNRWIIGDDLDTLVYNDGFNNQAEFFAYFNTTFKGKLIHWTDLKY